MIEITVEEAQEAVVGLAWNSPLRRRLMVAIHESKADERQGTEKGNCIYCGIRSMSRCKIPEHNHYICVTHSCKED